MEALVPIAIYVVLALTGLGALTIVIFGIKALFNGKLDFTTVVILTVPIALFPILGFTMDTWAEAGIWATLITLAMAAISLLISGARGLFT